MSTTLLNPTVWLLVTAVVVSVIGGFRGRDARDTIERVIRVACAWPVLLVLTIVAGAGLGSRVVLGFLAPGAYVEEVVAARTFIEQSELYASNDRGTVNEVLADSPAVPWTQVPGVTICQANAIANRARFYTEHAHTPMLLLAGVPVVQVAGDRGLYVVLALLALGAVTAIAGVLVQRAGIEWRSRQGLLVLAAVAGWQPVLAGIRQGDAVLPAAGLLAIAWHLSGRKNATGSAISAACASCLAPAAAGVLLALTRSAPRAAAAALGLVMTAAAATVALAGPAVISGFIRTAVETATTYAGAIPNYGVAGRLMMSGNGVIAGAFLAIVFVCSWSRARSVDASFASFTIAGALAAPVLWSQHLAVLIVPAAILFTSIAASRSSLLVGAWSLMVLSFSLPDPAMARLVDLAGPIYPASPLPIVPLMLVVFWAWITFKRVNYPAAHPAPAATATVGY